MAKKDGQMADYDETFEEGARGIAPVRLVRIAGAVSSIALVVSLGIWGYKIAVRDVMGIPVVRALEGAMRVAPAAPGGTVTAHQGLAVNDVAALGVATPLPDSLTLAPRPMTLAMEDAAGLAVDEEAALVTASAGLEDPAAFVMPGPESSSDALALALADVGGEPPARLPPVEVAASAPGPIPEDAIAAAVAEVAAEDVTVATPAPVTSTQRPLRRPVGLASAVAMPAPSPAIITDTQDVSAAVPKEVDAATLAVGAPLVQLGAFDTPEDARTVWARLAVQFPELATHGIVIQSATSGGQTFYRLRASDFAGDDQARQFCAVMLAANAACIPVAHR